MLKKAALILISILSILAVHATPKRIVSHGKEFSLERSVVVKATRADKDLKQAVLQLINSAGANSNTPFISLKTKPKIVIERVRSIEGVKEPDALQIKVTPMKVTINYTTEQSKKKVIVYLKALISGKVIQGSDITDWGGRSKNTKGIIDASTTLLSISEIESQTKGSHNKEVMIQFADSLNWRLESSVFALVNPDESPYPGSGYYHLERIAELSAKLAKSRMKIIPVIELLIPNETFLRVTGHSQFSVEGMRFVRAIIEEYASKLGCQKLGIGTLCGAGDKRYLEFVTDIASKCNIELVFNE